MVNVFETREITIDKNGFWKANLQRVTDWRKDIAVARYYKSSIKPSWTYFLIDKDFNYLFKKRSWDEDEIEGEQIERVFGGYYIVRDVVHFNFRTFPGQDRDTEYDYKTYIEAVLDENGTALSEEEKKEYLKRNPIKQTTECGGKIVECESSFYNLETYQYLFSIPKTLKPIGLYKNEKLRVSIVSDYRDFYAVVKRRKIVTVYDDMQFKFIEKLLSIIDEEIYLKSSNKNTKNKYKPVIPANKDQLEETVNIKVINLEATVVIEKYLLDLFVPYIIDGFGNFVYDENYGIKRWKFKPNTCYYFEDNEWRKIEESVAQEVFDKIYEQKCNRPNFIQNIQSIAEEIVLDGETFSIFKFECRPYGFITKEGKLDYNFDVNNIKW